MIQETNGIPSWLSITDIILKDVALVIAGVWAYWKFVKGRTHKSRIVPEITWKVIPNGENDQLCVTAKITNTGLFASTIEERGFIIQILEPIHSDSDNIQKLRWRDIGQFNVFTEQDMIEVGEVMQEELVITIPHDRFTMLQLKFFVWIGISIQSDKTVKKLPFHSIFQDEGSGKETSCIVSM